MLKKWSFCSQGWEVGSIIHHCFSVIGPSLVTKERTNFDLQQLKILKSSNRRQSLNSSQKSNTIPRDALTHCQTSCVENKPPPVALDTATLVKRHSRMGCDCPSCSDQTSHYSCFWERTRAHTYTHMHRGPGQLAGSGIYQRPCQEHQAMQSGVFTVRVFGEL